MRRILCTSRRLVSYRLMLREIRAGAKQVEDDSAREGAAFEGAHELGS